MSTAAESTSGNPGGGQERKESAPKDSSAKILADLAQTGMERLVAMQKVLLDMAVQQNSAAAEAAKGALSFSAAGPARDAMDLAAQGVEQFAQAQKAILDLAARQTSIALSFARDQMDATGPRVTALMADTIEEAGKRTIAAERAVLDYAAQQNDLLVNVLKPLGVPPETGRSFAESVREGMSALLDTQEQLLEVASRPLKAFTTSTGK